MFCYQCQETIGPCSNKGVCGKKGDTANLQDLLIYLLKGISYHQISLEEMDRQANEFLSDALFSTITNVNFDNERFFDYIQRAIRIRDRLAEKTGKSEGIIPDEASWRSTDREEILDKSVKIGFLSIEDEDRRSLVATIIYGLKGIAAYFHQATVLGFWDESIAKFINEALVATISDQSSEDELLDIVVRVGEYGVKTMALLDKANTEKYGKPRPTMVQTGVGEKPGILITGHDLRDLEELLEQTRDTGIDVYTHGEMLPAHYYPYFQKYDNLYGNYGNAWWKQKDEFEKFNGPILVTTNCLVPPKDSYKDRVYTTSVVGFNELNHIPDRTEKDVKDFTPIIELAKKCPPPTELEGEQVSQLVGGFSHFYLDDLLDGIIEKVKEGKISRFYVMAGCDGRHKTRQYYTDFAKELPKDAVILTAGCAKYRYNKLNLGEIDGIPRVLDAGQCNDSYSLAITALSLAKKLGTDLNSLPISYEIAWYEQKATLVLLSLFYLGIRNINLGPSLPAFVTPRILKTVEQKLHPDLNPDQYLIRAPKQ